MELLNKNKAWNTYASNYRRGTELGVSDTQRQTEQTAGGYGTTYAGDSAGQIGDEYMAKLYGRYTDTVGKVDAAKGSAVNGNAIWEMYRDNAIRGGRQAMRDTLGQYEAQTGGYGNSLATGAATNAYLDYLDKANQGYISTLQTPKVSSGGSGKKKQQKTEFELNQTLYNLDDGTPTGVNDGMEQYAPWMSDGKQYYHTGVDYVYTPTYNNGGITQTGDKVHYVWNPKTGKLEKKESK